MNIQRITLTIYGLGCGGGGALTIERALTKLLGITQVYVNPATEMAYVAYDPGRTTLHQITAAIERVGFRAGEPLAR